MKTKLPFIIALPLCFAGSVAFGQSLSVKKQPSGNGPILNMHITKATAVGDLGGLCDFGGEKSVPCSSRGDVQISTSPSHGDITQYRYNGKTYPVEELGEMACYSCSRVKITGVIKAGGKTFTVSKERSPIASGSYHLPFDIGSSVPSNSISLVSLTIEPISHPDFESKLDNLAAQKTKKEKSEKEKQEATAKNDNASGRSNRDSVTTSGSSWQSLNQEAEDESSATQSSRRPSEGTRTASSGDRPGRQSANTRSQRNHTNDDRTMSWEEQQALARRQSQIRKQEQAQLEQALAPMGETVVMMDEMIPDATENWADFYLGADDAKGLSAWRLGIESRMYHGDKFIIYFGFAGILATKFDYYFADDESKFSKSIHAQSKFGLELQLGIGSRILGEEENEEDAGSALYWGLLGYIGGLDGGDLENPDDPGGFNVMGFYGPRLLVGYRMSHVALRFSYSLCFTDKRYYMGLSTYPGADDKPMSGMVQVQLAYSW